jgi:WD40 repeat protein
LVASATTDGTVRIWESRSGQEVATLENAVLWLNDMVFTPDGTQIIYVATDGIRIWNIESAIALNGDRGDFRVIASPAEGEFIDSIALNPDGTILAAGYLDSTIKLWDIETGEQLTILTGHSERVTSLAFSPDGTLLASGGTDGTVRLWGVAAGDA